MVRVDFGFLKNSLLADQLAAGQKIAKLYEIGDYRDVIINERIVLESVVKKIFDWENFNHYYPLPEGEYHDLRNDLNYLQNEVAYPLSIFQLMNEIRHLGNDAIHDPHYQLGKGAAWRAICDLNDILVFLLNSYDGQKLNYLRPDIAFEAQANKSGKFKARRVINNFTKAKGPTKNVQEAKKVLKQKRKGHFQALRHFLRH